MNKYFISDTHFWHKNIIKYCNRPFKDELEMNRVIINNWNSRVKKDDLVIHLGDWGFTKSTEAPKGKKFHEIYNILNGNIIVLRGSHDKNNGVKSPIKKMIITLGGRDIELLHDPKNISENVSWHICGHLHGKYGKFMQKGKHTIVDLSVENWNYTPVTITEILQAYSIWRKK